MNDPLNNLKQSLSHLRLSAEEKSLLRSNIAAHARFGRSRRPESRHVIPWLSLATAGAIVAVMFVSAEHTLPGDALYPVKISVTEPARGLLAGSEDEALDWDLELIGRRIAEEEKLIAEAQL